MTIDLESATTLLSAACLVVGGFLGVTGALGLFRFPEFYTRLHAASVTDTLCAALIILGLVLQTGLSLFSVKLILILLFLAYTSPTAAHALAKAAQNGGLKPTLHDDRTNTNGAEPSNS